MLPSTFIVRHSSRFGAPGAQFLGRWLTRLRCDRVGKGCRYCCIGPSRKYLTAEVKERAFDEPDLSSETSDGSSPREGSWLNWANEAHVHLGEKHGENTT